MSMLIPLKHEVAVEDRPLAQAPVSDQPGHGKVRASDMRARIGGSRPATCEKLDTANAAAARPVRIDERNVSAPFMA